MKRVSIVQRRGIHRLAHSAWVRARMWINRLVFALRWEVWRKPPYATRYLGYRLTYLPGDMIVTTYARRGAYEPDVISYVRHHLCPGSVVIDVGANIGLFGLAVLRLVPQSFVHLFEPSPLPRGLLSRTLECNDLSSRTRLNPQALYSECGEREFLVHSAKHAALDGLRDTHYRNVDVPRPVRVPVITLDSYVRESGLDRLDLLKIDAEGAELCILKGAVRTLSSLRPRILFEVGSENLAPYAVTPSDLYQHLVSQDYQVYTLRGVALSESEFVRLTDTEHEFVAVPCGSAPRESEV